MDMSDKLVAEGADELERDRERLRAENRVHGTAFGGQSIYSIRHRLKLMFGAAAAASGLLGVLALGGLATGGAVSSSFLVAIVLVALATVAMTVLAMRFVQDQLVHPIEAVCASLRDLAEGNREAYDVNVPHSDRSDEIGAMARYVVVIKKAANKFYRLRKEREEAEAEEHRRFAELEHEREEHRSQQSQTIGTLADKFERTIGEIV